MVVFSVHALSITLPSSSIPASITSSPTPVSPRAEDGAHSTIQSMMTSLVVSAQSPIKDD